MKEEVKFRGKQEKIVVKPILTRSVNPNVTDAEHEAYFLFATATRDYVLPLDRQLRLVNPFESKEEKEWLEDELKVDLNINKPTDNYWHKFKVKLGKEDKHLDLTRPKDYLEYLVLKCNKQFIAPLGTNKTSYLATQKYAMTKEGDEIKETANRANKYGEAWRAFGKIENDKQAMINFLRVYGQTTTTVGTKRAKITNNTKTELLVSMIDEIINKDVDGFLSIIRSKDDYELKILIANAVDCGAINKVDRKYFLLGGDPMCEEGLISTLDNAVNWLKSPKNQELVIILQNRVENANQ